MTIQSIAVPQVNSIELSNGTCRFGRGEAPHRAISDTLRGQLNAQPMVPLYDVRTPYVSPMHGLVGGCLSYCRKLPN